MSRPPLYYEITRDGAVAIWRGPLDVIDLVHDLVEGRDFGAAVAGSIRRHVPRSPASLILMFVGSGGPPRRLEAISAAWRAQSALPLVHIVSMFVPSRRNNSSPAH